MVPMLNIDIPTNRSGIADMIKIMKNDTEEMEMFSVKFALGDKNIIVEIDNEIISKNNDVWKEMLIAKIIGTFDRWIELLFINPFE